MGRSGEPNGSTDGLRAYRDLPVHHQLSGISTPPYWERDVGRGDAFSQRKPRFFQQGQCRTQGWLLCHAQRVRGPLTQRLARRVQGT